MNTTKIVSFFVTLMIDKYVYVFGIKNPKNRGSNEGKYDFFMIVFFFSKFYFVKSHSLLYVLLIAPIPKYLSLSIYSLDQRVVVLN